MIGLQKTLSASAVAAAVMFSCNAPLIAAPATGTPVDLNVIIPVSGPGTFIGKSQQDALTAMESVVNKDGGVRGRPIHFIVRDDATSPQTAVQDANAALEEAECEGKP